MRPLALGALADKTNPVPDPWINAERKRTKHITYFMDNPWSADTRHMASLQHEIVTSTSFHSKKAHWDGNIVLEKCDSLHNLHWHILLLPQPHHTELPVARKERTWNHIQSGCSWICCLPNDHTMSHARQEGLKRRGSKGSQVVRFNGCCQSYS